VWVFSKKRALSRVKLLFDVGFANVDGITNNVLMRDPRFVFTTVVIANLSAALGSKVFPIGKIDCIDDHVVAKNKLARRGSKGRMIGSLETKSNILYNSVHSSVIKFAFV
jgi:hypothetical protein